MIKSKAEALIKEIEQQGGTEDFNAPRPAVSVDLFFKDNDDPGSLGCNIPEDEYPGLHKFYEVLKEIRSRDDVQDVLMKIYEVEDDFWPFSDEVYILTSASLNEVESWVKELLPSKVYSDDNRTDGKDWKSIRPPKGPDLLQGMRAYYVWWD